MSSPTTAPLRHMPRRDVLLAILVSVCWGVNFLAIHASLGHYPPMFLVALRFAVLAVPTLLLVPRPQVPLRWLLGYGVGFGIVQFVFLYAGLAAGMPVGLSSLVLQASAPFTVLIAAVFLRERPTRAAWIGIALALSGLGVIAAYRGLVVSLLPTVLVLIGALGWACGNIASRQAQADSPFRLMMWMTVVPPLPMLALSLAVEGPGRIGHALATGLSREAWPADLGLLYTVLVGTVVGSGIWTSLLRRHPSSSVAPFSLLVPVTGITTAWLVLGEVPALPEVLGGLLVVVGVVLPHLRRSRRTPVAHLAPDASAEPVRAG
ncbi:EamA family transporter [Nocardioides luti]